MIAHGKRRPRSRGPHQLGEASRCAPRRVSNQGVPTNSNELADRFTYHPATTPERRDEHDHIRTACGELAAMLNARLPEGRETALAFTNLEQVMFWANAAIARQPS